MAVLDHSIKRLEGASSVWVQVWRDFRTTSATYGAEVSLCGTCSRWRGAARGLRPVTHHVPGICAHCAAGGGE
jgi:hypothetical protein